jgi:hypothetical protein
MQQVTMYIVLSWLANCPITYKNKVGLEKLQGHLSKWQSNFNHAKIHTKYEIIYHTLP